MRKILILLAAFYSFSASAYFQLDFMKAKAQNKVASQWTLADWLAQKGRMQLADQWLALNRSVSILEINPSGGYQTFKIKTRDASGETSVNGSSQSYQLDTYISIVNLLGEYEKTNGDIEAYGGALGLRLLGNSSQTTNLVARYGWRKLRDLSAQETWENQFAEAQLQIYLVSAFGLQGRYRHYFPNESNLGTKFEGHKVTAGAFIEVAPFRLFADYFQEPVEKTSGGAVTKEQRDGFEYGLKLFF